MEKLDLSTPNFTSENIAKLAELFPNCVTEKQSNEGGVQKAIDFDLLRLELSATVVEGQQERYSINWPGKREALVTANTPISKTLRPYRKESVSFDTTKNVFIEGDNLDALKLLQETYLSKIQMIYIDPPYNTGNDFIYNDNFAANKEDYNEASGQRDSEGGRLVANPDSNGRYHSDWLSMMFSRLKLARNLLREDGVVFISIDDNEIGNLKRICEEIFGEENFVDQIIWKKRYGGGAKEKHLVTLHEYIVMFARNKAALKDIHVPLEESSIKRYYKQRDDNFDKRGAYRTHPLEATKSMGERKNLVFPIEGPGGIEIWPKRQWLWSKNRVEEALRDGELEFLKGKNETWSVHSKQYLYDQAGNIRQAKFFSIIDDVYSQHGTNEIIELFGEAQIFSFPKPTGLMEKLLDISCAKGGIVLDLFSGSGSLADAVFGFNHRRNISTNFISVQLPEAIIENSTAFKEGYKTIAEVGKERIRRAGKKIRKDNAGAEGIESLDTGFRVFKIDSSNMIDVHLSPDDTKPDMFDDLTANIKDDRNSEDLLFQILLDWGVDLSLPITKQEVSGKETFFVDGNALAACFEEGIDEDYVKRLAQHKPLRVVFRDDGFGSGKDGDSVKINVEQIFRLKSPATDIKVI